MHYTSLIFDLDDTLLDTWGQLVQPAAREACQAMIDAGLRADLDTALRQRQAFHMDAPRSDLYARLTEHFDVREGVEPRTVRDAGHNAYFNREVEAGIRLFEGAHDLLAKSAASFTLFLVTSGHPDTQRQKVRLLDIAHHFEDVFYVWSSKGETKKAAFEQILERTGHEPHQHLAVGDRLDREIKAANNLGMRSCHIHYGEFRHIAPSAPDEEPHIQITHIRELEDHLFP